MDVLTLVTPPPPEALWNAWEAELRSHCRAGDDDDGVLKSSLAAAYGRLDGRNGWLGRALLRQTWRLALPQFRPQIIVPLPPLRTVDEIAVRDPDGIRRVMAVDDWEIVPTEPACLRLRSRVPVPRTDQCHDAVTITFEAGYGTPGDLPPVVKVAIFRHVATLYENRESAAYGSGSYQQAPGGDLLADLQVWSF